MPFPPRPDPDWQSYKLNFRFKWTSAAEGALIEAWNDPRNTDAECAVKLAKFDPEKRIPTTQHVNTRIQVLKTRKTLRKVPRDRGRRRKFSSDTRDFLFGLYREGWAMTYMSLATGYPSITCYRHLKIAIDRKRLEERKESLVTGKIEQKVYGGLEAETHYESALVAILEEEDGG